MTNSAYVMGTLSWPMPDLGLVAVWRAMPIDGSQWDDWGDFEQGRHEGTVGTLVDAAAVPELALDELGVTLRARVTDAAVWQRIVVAWRAAADLGATGELVWCAEQQDRAYRVTVREYGSQWEKLSDAAAAALQLGGLQPEPGPAPAPAARKPRAATAKPAAKAVKGKPAKAKPAKAKPAAKGKKRR